MAFYQFYKELRLTDAFTKYLEDTYGELFSHFEYVPPFQEPYIRIFFTRELTQEEQTLLTSRIESYVNPSYYLKFSHTDNAFMDSPISNSSQLTVVQSFIISPYNTDSTAMGDLKTIVKYDCSDISSFSSWDSLVDPPIICTLQLFDYTNNNVIYTIDININFIINNWKQGINDPYWKTVQVYGLKDAVPSSDAIWQIKLAISDSRVNVSLNGMQRIFYDVIS